MLCPHCGMELRPGEKTCSHCGFDTAGHKPSSELGAERRSANVDAYARNANQAESRKPARGRKMTLSPPGFSRSPWRPSPSSRRFARWTSKTLGNHKKAASRTSPAIRRRQAPTNRLLGSMKPLWETTRVPIDHKSKVILE